MKVLSYFMATLYFPYVYKINSTVRNAFFKNHYGHLYKVYFTRKESGGKYVSFPNRSTPELYAAGNLQL